MRKKALFVAVLTLAGMVGDSVRLSASEQPSSTLLFVACRTDGTYDCGYDCNVAPYNGRWCCEF